MPTPSATGLDALLATAPEHPHTTYAAGSEGGMLATRGDTINIFAAHWITNPIASQLPANHFASVVALHSA